MTVFYGLLIPLLGTSLGAAFVFFMRGGINVTAQKGMLGFASGVMVAASVWSLLIPSIEMSAGLGRFSFFPAASGFLLGVFFLLLLDRLIPHLHLQEDVPEGIKVSLKKSTMLMLAVTLHNIPEGMAVGVAFAGFMNGQADITLYAALALSIGIAVQNIPEGAVISMPLKAKGIGTRKAFFLGVLSGAVEPVFAFITIALAGITVPALPYTLSFAAGAMIYVVVEELIPETASGPHSNAGTLGFAFGFALMMVLDVALG